MYAMHKAKRILKYVDILPPPPPPPPRRPFRCSEFLWMLLNEYINQYKPINVRNLFKIS